MSGIGVLFVIGLYFFIAYKIVGALKTRRLKWLAVVILVLIPTADSVVGRVYLQHLCATEGGLKVNRVVQGVEGYMGEFSGPPDPNPVEEYNFRFSESKVSEERVNRYSKLNGQIVIENDVAPISKYRVRNPRPGETRDIYVRQEKVVETYPGGEILAIDSQIGFLGGWVERFVASFSGGGSRGGSPSWCEGKDILVRKKELILSTLKH